MAEETSICFRPASSPQAGDHHQNCVRTPFPRRNTIDAAFAALDGSYVALADGTGGILRYGGTTEDDVPSKAELWKRTLRYTVEYPTVAVQKSPPILFPQAGLTVFAPLSPGDPLPRLQLVSAP